MKKLPPPESLSPAERTVLLAADRIAQSDPATRGGVWADPESEAIILGAIDADARAKVVGELADAGLGNVEVELVDHSTAELDAIVQNVYSLPGAEEVNSAWHDWPNNRVVAVASNPSDALRATLAQAYGDAVVVQDGPDMRAMDSRDEDGSPLRGGSRWKREHVFTGAGGYCSMGFAWKAGDESSANYMITAGHCFPKGKADTDWAVNDFGGDNGDYDYVLGVITAGNSTFRNGEGTVEGNGDLARINLKNFDRVGSAAMWTGDWNSTSYRYITGVRRWAAEGDDLCLSGAYSGANCNYTVTDTDATYEDGGEVFRQQVRATKDWGHCSRPGDSGGSIYRRTSDTNAWAFGIHSGGSGGGDDHYISEGEGLFVDCHISFTVIGQAYQQWTSGEVATIN